MKSYPDHSRKNGKRKLKSKWSGAAAISLFRLVVLMTFISDFGMWFSPRTIASEFHFNILISLLFLFFNATNEAAAVDRPFVGRWHSEQAPFVSSLGSVRHGDALILFSADGWASAEVFLEAPGWLASGKGKWAVTPDGLPVDVSVRAAVLGGRLYLMLTPLEANGAGAGVLKLMFDEMEPELSDVERFGP